FMFQMVATVGYMGAVVIGAATGDVNAVAFAIAIWSVLISPARFLLVLPTGQSRVWQIMRIHVQAFAPSVPVFVAGYVLEKSLRSAFDDHHLLTAAAVFLFVLVLYPVSCRFTNRQTWDDLFNLVKSSLRKPAS